MSKTQKHDSLVIEKYSAGIMCHHFHGDGIPKTQRSISYDEFKCIIEAIPRERIIDADEWLWRVKKNCLVGDEICFTFDDNDLLCQYQIALGVLNEFGIKAFGLSIHHRSKEFSSGWRSTEFLGTCFMNPWINFIFLFFRQQKITLVVSFTKTTLSLGHKTNT